MNRSYPVTPVGRYVLLLQTTDDVCDGQILLMGSAVPREYLANDRKRGPRGIRNGDHVRIVKEHIVDEFTDEDMELDEEIKYTLVHIDGIAGIVDKK